MELNPGTSDSSGSITYSYDLSSQCDGVNKIFSIPSYSSILLLIGTDAPLVYRPTIDYSVSGIILTMTSAVNAPSSGATLILEYTV